jgi:hypothetical protein
MKKYEKEGSACPLVKKNLRKKETYYDRKKSLNQPLEHVQGRSVVDCRTDYLGLRGDDIFLPGVVEERCEGQNEARGNTHRGVANAHAGAHHLDHDTRTNSDTCTGAHSNSGANTRTSGCTTATGTRCAASS